MMEIEEDDILRNVAAGGSMDYSIWPALLPRIISRIEKIAHDEFPIPNLPPPPPPPPAAVIPSSIPRPPAQLDSETTENFLSPLPSSPLEPDSAASSQDANKENTPVVPPSAPAPTSVPAPVTPLAPGKLPPQIDSMLTEITSTLDSTFPSFPPHTIQRLSELVLTPKHHYRSLPSYLHALDRVVHVTSGLNVYPLPPAVPDALTATVLAHGAPDGQLAVAPWATPGSDEALGGALLTPIPWLQPNRQALGGSPQQQPQPQSQSQSTPAATPEGASAGNDLQGEVRTESTETIDGPNGMGSIETVSVSVNGISSMGARGVGVTQGELLRQEQKAGIVPVSQLVPSHHVHNSISSSIHHHQHNTAQLLLLHQSQQAMNTTITHSSASTASPDSTSANNSAETTPSSATLGQEEERVPADATAAVPSPSETPSTAEESQANANAPLGSVSGGTDDEKPHARGPEEIGADDLGPQHASTTAPIGISGASGGVEMQGIDIAAAVGRKPVGVPTHTAASGYERDEGTVQAPEKAEGTGAGTEGDKMEMDIETDTAPARSERALTPKREAEEILAGDLAKKLKQDPESTAKPETDAAMTAPGILAATAEESKPAEAETKQADSEPPAAGDGEAVEGDREGKGEVTAAAAAAAAEAVAAAGSGGDDKGDDATDKRPEETST
ncbi:hypothetical protein F4778DRAFT_801835 [Xylariomycetidae sp. FL2044]|nr:hypothetical protein F4778DRAFT_801835 [Xylariomycetidae sp. FL2044]